MKGSEGKEKARTLSKSMNIDIRKKVCRQFCPYYKPLKKEDLTCRGFLVVERLLEKGKKLPFEKADIKIEDSVVKNLIKHMCFACSFYESDCDFVMESGKSHHHPACGGFTVLGLLLQKRIISIDDIGNII